MQRMPGAGAIPAPRRWPWRRRPRGYVSHLERVLGTSLELQVAAPSRAAAERAEAAATVDDARDTAPRLTTHVEK